MIPALRPTEGEFRALTIHDVVSAGHIAVLVTRPDWQPHLRPGEFAVLDPSDTEPQFGEVYGLMIGTGGRPKLKLVQPYRSELFAGCPGVMYRFGLPGSRWGAYADGPLQQIWWHRKCRGRVVGVLQAIDVEGANA